MQTQSWILLTFDTGGEFPKQAQSEPACLIMKAGSSLEPPISWGFGHASDLTFATPSRPNTSPPISKERENPKVLARFARTSARMSVGEATSGIGHCKIRALVFADSGDLRGG